MKDVELSNKVDFIMKLGSAFHRYGTNAPRLELALTNIANSLGITGNFFSTPTYLAVSIDTEDGQVTRHIRVSPGEVNLAKLSAVDHIADEVCDGKLSIDKGIKFLDKVKLSSDRYNKTITTIAFGLTSLALAIIFGGSFIDASFAFTVGSVLGLVGMLTSKSEDFSNIFEFVAAFVCTVLAYIMKYAFPSTHFQIVLMASLIVIIPGLSLTIAMVELAAKNLVSGTARFMGAIVDFFKISFGVMAGIQTGKFFFSSLAPDMSFPLPDFWIIPAIVVGSLAFTIIFKARPKDFKWILLSGLSAIFAIKVSGWFLSGVLSIFIAGLVVGAGSNIFARIYNRPAMIPLLPGIIFLVPGSIGFRGVNLIFENKYSHGLGIGFQMFIIAITIVAGLFLANVLVNPRRSL